MMDISIDKKNVYIHEVNNIEKNWKKSNPKRIIWCKRKSIL